MSEKRKMDEGEQTPPGKKAKAVAAAQNGKATVVNGDGEIVRSQEYMLQAQRLEMVSLMRFPLALTISLNIESVFQCSLINCVFLQRPRARESEISRWSSTCDEM